MRRFFVYIRIELKRALKTLPQLMTGAVVLILLLGTIAFSVSRMLYEDSVSGRISVGVVLPEEEGLTKTAMNMITSMDSVKSLCDFQYMEEEEARRALNEGELYAVMLLPSSLIEGIMNGSNPAITILASNTPGVEGLLFEELTRAGAKTLSVAQAAIYAADEFCHTYELSASIPEVEDTLNKIYLKYSLARADYFDQKEIVASGDVPLISYYGVSAVSLLLLLCGIPCAGYLRPETKVLKQKLTMMGIVDGKVIFTRILSTMCLLFCVLLPITIGVFLTGLRVTYWSIPLLLCICFYVAAMLVFLYELFYQPMASIMVLFLTAVIMMFLSGGFLPLVFLPEGLRGLAPFMPTTLLMDLLKMFVTEEISLTVIGKALLIGALLGAAGTAVRRNHG